MPDTIDISSYQDYAKQPSMADTIGKYAGIKSQLNQNQLFQQTFDARNAMGSIFQQAGGDPDKAQALALQNPATAYLAPDIAKQMSELQTSMAQAKINNLSAQQKGYEQAAGIIQGHLAAGDHSDEALLDIAQQALSNPTILNAIGQGSETVGRQTIIKSLTDMPPYQAGVSDPSMQPRHKALLGLYGKMLAGSGAAGQAAVQGQIQLQNVGGVVKPLQLSPAMQSVKMVGPDIQNTLPPTAQVFDPNKGGMVYVGGASGAPASEGGAQPSQGGNASATQPGAPGTLAAAPPLGAEPAANVTATGAANQGLSLQSRADQVPATKALLGNLEGSLNNFTSGPGADWKKVAEAAANANSPFGNIFDPKKIASQEEFGKQAFQLAQQQFQALGGTGTDSKLDSTMHTSPSELMSKLGNQGIIHMLKGNEDAIVAKNSAWQDWSQKHGPQTYGQFSNDFNKNFDPRIFQAQYMTGDEKKQMLSGMTTSEVDALKQKTRHAINEGWIKVPGK